LVSRTQKKEINSEEREGRGVLNRGCKPTPTQVSEAGFQAVIRIFHNKYWGATGARGKRGSEVENLLFKFALCVEQCETLKLEKQMMEK